VVTTGFGRMGQSLFRWDLVNCNVGNLGHQGGSRSETIGSVMLPDEMIRDTTQREYESRPRRRAGVVLSWTSRVLRLAEWTEHEDYRLMGIVAHNTVQAPMRGKEGPEEPGQGNSRATRQGDWWLSFAAYGYGRRGGYARA